MSPESARLALLDPFEAWEGTDLEDLPVLIKVSRSFYLSPRGGDCFYAGRTRKRRSQRSLAVLFNDRVSRRNTRSLSLALRLL